MNVCSCLHRVLVHCFRPLNMKFTDVMCCLACFVLGLVILCALSHTAKFYVKLICFYITIFLLTLAMIPATLFRPKDPGNLLYATWLIHNVINLIFSWEWKIVNPELLQSDEACVIVCNHQSAIDICGMMHIWPLFHPCLPVLKKELLFSGPFGIYCWLSGCVFVDRFNTKQARDTLNLKVQEMKEKKIKLWIFPEGTRNDSGSLLPFKKGAFHIATQAKIPIVPLVFSPYSDFYSSRKRIFDGGTITITVLPRIETSDLSSEDVPPLTEKVRSLMSECLSKSLSLKSVEKQKNGNLIPEHSD